MVALISMRAQCRTGFQPVPHATEAPERSVSSATASNAGGPPGCSFAADEFGRIRLPGALLPSGTGWKPIPHCAFTLIELLVVIAIIALLATLGTAAWQRSQRYSRAAACMQNLRSIGAGLARYVGEHDGVFPELAMARVSKSDNVPVIDTELLTYVTDARVFACPDDSKHLSQTSGTSYLWNNRLNGQRLATLSVSFLAMDAIDEPSRIMVMGDKEGFHPNIENKLNVLYADGHASQQLTFVDDTPQK